MAIVEPEPFGASEVVTGTVRADEGIDVQAGIAGKLMKIHSQEGATVRADDLLADIKDRGGVPQQEYDIAASEPSILRDEVELIHAQLARTEIHAPFDGTIGLRSVSERIRDPGQPSWP